MTRPSEAHAAETQHTVLRETLRLAVPMHMIELHNWGPEHLAVVASDAATTVGSHGDALQFGGKHCSDTFNAVARGLAAAALTAQGGVDFLGLHWCANPHCRVESRFDHANQLPDDPDIEAEPPDRPIADVPTRGLL